MSSQGHPWSRGKGQIENCGFGYCDTCLKVRISSITQKMAIVYLCSGPNRTKFEHGKIAAILVNSVKMAFWGHSKQRKAACLKISFWNFVRTFIDKCSFTCNPFLSENSKMFVENFVNQFFDDCFSQNLKISKNSQFAIIFA